MRDLIAYFASYGLSLLGNGIAAVVLPLLVLDRTGDVLAAGLVATAGSAASVLVGLVAGVVVDRSDRRILSLVADLVSAVSIVALIVIDLTVGLTVTWFLALAVLGSIIDVPGTTAREVLLPAVARRLPGGASRLDRLVAARESLAAVMVLVGPGIGGLLVWLLGLEPMLLVVTATTSVAAALSTLLIGPEVGRLERSAVADAESDGGFLRVMARDLLQGWSFLFGTPILLVSTVLTIALVAAVAPLQSTLIPAYFTAEGAPGFAGLVISALAAGSLVGSLCYATVTDRLTRRVWLMIAMIGTVAGFVAVGALAAPVVVLAGAALIGLSMSPATAILGVLTIEATPDRLRGRVMAAQNVLIAAVTALSIAPVAAFAAGAGLQAAGLLLAALVAVVAIGCLFTRSFRSLGG